jgi:dihydroorotate dehydrogenase
VYKLIRPLLFLLPPEVAHAVGMLGLRILGWLRFLGRRLRRAASDPALAITVSGLRFPNPIVLAAGLDKDGTAVEGLYALGFGGLEIGTITPRPQPGNPRPRVFRLPAHRALINRMGFNNQGAAAAAARLARLRDRPAPLGVNIGKNRDTPLAAATADYLACIDALAPAADFLVVNLSSPNTPGLRSLQEPEALAALLAAARARTTRPLFLKIAPDLTDDAVDAAVDVAVAQRLDGVIATNTTLERAAVAAHPRAGEAGGLSGAPLAARSTEVIRRAYRRAAGRLAIVGVGGVFTVDDVVEKLRAGASLVQLYTGFIYEGPGVVRRLARELRARLAAEGVALADLVGRDA